MHNRRRILLGAAVRLHEQCGPLVPARIHSARAASIADPSEGTIIIVERSTAEVWDIPSSAISRTYVLTITAGMDGLAPDLAGIGLEASCPERFDDLALTDRGVPEAQRRSRPRRAGPRLQAPGLKQRINLDKI